MSNWQKAKQASRRNDQPQRRRDQGQGDQRRSNRVGDGQRDQAAGSDILPGRDNDVGHRFRAGVDHRPRPGLAGMGEEGRAAAEQEAADLDCRIPGIDDGKAEQGAAQRPHPSVDRVPGAVDPGDLVGEEFRKRARGGDADDPVGGEHVERAKLLGHGNESPLHRHARDQGDEIEPPAGQQADRRGERHQFEGGHGAKPSRA